MRPHDYGGARLLMFKVAGRYGCTLEQIVGRGRHPTFVHVRKEIARELYGAEFSYPEIGRLMNRDHSSVHYYVNGRAR